MQNIDVRFNATSNFGKVTSDLAALQAQVAALNASFAKGAYATPPAIIDRAKWANGASAISAASRAYREAASSSGLLNAQQMVATSEAEKYTRALQKQKVTLREVWKHRNGIMKEVYNDQLRQQRMTAQYWGTDQQGRQITDITMPKNVPTELDNWRRRAGFFGNAMASAGTQVINTGKNIQWAGRQLMVGFTYPMMLFGAAAGVMAFKVEDAFAKINKVYDVSQAAQTNAALKERELGELRVNSLNAAREAAVRYGTTVEKFLAIEGDLAASGLGGDQLISTSGEVARISALGDIDAEQTTDMVVALQTAFRKTIPDGEALTRTLNFMTATSNLTSLSLQDIAEATPRAASGMAALGVTAEQMTILLVSMREAGVKAAEGANALKSATTRILNETILTKTQDRLNSFGVEGVNLNKMAQDANGNLFEFIKNFGIFLNSQEGLSDYQRQAAVATLFGTYQFNRMSAALQNVGLAYAGIETAGEKNNNQTMRGIELQQRSAEQLEKYAKDAEEQMMDNPAGRFKQAWAQFQMLLSDMGGPFLDFATKMLNALGKIGQWFMDLPSGMQKFLAYSAGLAALAGPIIMLVGLFLNLSGWVVKLIGSFAKFIGISKLTTREQTAAALTTETVNQALAKQGPIVSTLAAEIRVLSAAYAEATAKAAQFLAATGGTRATTAPPARFTNTTNGTTTIGNTPGARMAGMAGYTLTAAEQRHYDATDRRLSNIVRLEQARNALAQEHMRANGQAARDATAQQRRAAATAALTERMRNGMSGAAVATGVAAVSMGVLMSGAEGTTAQIAKWTLIGSMVVPAVIQLTAWMGKAATAAWSMAAASMTAARGAGGAAAAAGIRGTMTAVGAGIAGMMTPMGWLVTGAVAVGAAWWAVNKHIDNSKKKIAEQIAETDKLQANVVTLTERWAEATGRAYQNYKRYNQEGAIDQSRKAQDNYQSVVTQYETPNEEGGFKSEVDEFGNLRDDEKRLALMVKMSKFIYNMKMGAEEAKMQMAAFLDATGEGAVEARLAAEELYASFSKTKGMDWSNLALDSISGLVYEGFASGDQPEKIKALGEQAGVFWAQAFANGTRQKSEDLLNSLSFGIISHWDRSMTQFKDALNSDNGFDVPISLKLSEGPEAYDAEIARVEELKRTLSDAESVRDDFFSMSDSEFADKYSNYFPSNDEFDSWRKTLEFSEAIERSIVSSAGNILSLNKEVDTLGELMDSAAVQAQTLLPEEKTQRVKDIMAEIANLSQRRVLAEKGLSNENIGELDEQRRALVAILIIMQNMGGIKFDSPGMKTMFNMLTAGAEEAEEKVKKVDKSIKDLRGKSVNININVNQLGGIFQGAMDNVKEMIVADSNYIFEKTQQTLQDDMQDAHTAATDALQDRQEAASNAMQDRHEAASRALQERQEAAMRAFEERWEKRKDALTATYDRRNKAIDNTIKREQKADEIRQRLYEREKKRLETLAERANTQIDFDVAINTGNLDEAAKIQNDAEAKGMSEQMEAEQKRAEQQTQNLIDRLEKKRERLEKARDRALKRLEKVEERMRRSLEKMQEAQQRALQKQQEAQQRALQQQQEAESRALQKQQEAEERAAQRSRDLARREHDYKMELFKALPAANKKQLEKALRAAGIDLTAFGKEVLGSDKGIAADWGGYFQKYLDQGLRKGAADAANSNMWEGVTNQIAKKMLRGFGFADLKQFENFVRTGKKGGGGNAETRHGGGEIGSNDRQSRAGLGGGLHRTEQMIRAQKGEYIINRKAYAANRELVRGINNGNLDAGRYLAHGAINGRQDTRGREGLGGFPADMNRGGLGSVAHLGYGYGTGYRSMTSGMREGIKDGLAVARAKAKAARERRRQRRLQQQNPGNGSSNLPVVPGGPINDIGLNALNWAARNAYVNPNTGKDWLGMCLSFVRQALGAPGGVVDATRSWYGTKYKRSAANYKDIPGGVPVYWTNGAHGHVILSAGGGKAVGTDNRVSGAALPTTIADVASWIGSPPVGWSADINGKGVYTPALRNGGEIRYDDTLVNGHNGETMLTKSLTQRFKENVKNGNYNGGGDHFTLDFRGATIKEEVDIQRAVETAMDNRDRRRGLKRKVGG